MYGIKQFLKHIIHINMIGTKYIHPDGLFVIYILYSSNTNVLFCEPGSSMYQTAYKIDFISFMSSVEFFNLKIQTL